MCCPLPRLSLNFANNADNANDADGDRFSLHIQGWWCADTHLQLSTVDWQRHLSMFELVTVDQAVKLLCTGHPKTWRDRRDRRDKLLTRQTGQTGQVMLLIKQTGQSAQ